jgi:glycosyltransferase involved in cell wall biosynthesis
MEPNGLVTIIIPAYNAEKFIGKTLDSVKSQTYEAWECIVIDDGSSDITADIIKEYASKDKRFRYIHGQHGGVSRARNLGIAAAQGEYIALLDHDDLWTPEKLAKQVPILLQHPEIGLVYCDAYVQTPDKTIRHSRMRTPYAGQVFHRLVRGNFIICLTAVMRKNLLQQRPDPFVPELQMAEEFELFLWIAARSIVGYIDEPLATYVVHGTNDSLKRWEIILRELKTIHDKLSKDPAVIALDRSSKSLRALLRLIDREEILIKWKNGQQVRGNLLRFLRGCNLKTDWRYILAMPFLSYKSYNRLARVVRRPF